MKRFIRFLAIASMSSVYLMQIPCTTNYTSGSGVSIIPNIPNPFTGFFGT